MSSPSLSRRALITAGAAAAVSVSFALQSSVSTAADENGAASVVVLERKLGGRIGVAALATGSGGRIDYRADERFPMCSTFNFLLPGACLARGDRGIDNLNRLIPYR